VVSGNFHGTKMATVAHIRGIPSDSEDSELYVEDLGNNCSGIISISESSDYEKMFHLCSCKREVGK
jgi:hypothetical protein